MMSNDARPIVASDAATDTIRAESRKISSEVAMPDPIESKGQP